jgi:hypothetical protein
MRLVIVCELFLWRVVSCCWLPLICWLADHALAVTFTDGLGLGLGPIRLEKCVGDAVARVAVELFVFKNYPFSYSVHCIPEKDKQNADLTCTSSAPPSQVPTLLPYSIKSTFLDHRNLQATNHSARLPLLPPSPPHPHPCR